MSQLIVSIRQGLASELPSVTSREGSGKQVPYPTKALQFHNGGVEDLQF